MRSSAVIRIVRSNGNQASHVDVAASGHGSVVPAVVVGRQSSVAADDAGCDDNENCGCQRGRHFRLRRRRAHGMALDARGRRQRRDDDDDERQPAAATENEPTAAAATTTGACRMQHNQDRQI